MANKTPPMANRAYPLVIGGRAPARSYQRPTRGAMAISGRLAGSRTSPATPGLMPRLRISSSGKMTPRPISAAPARPWLMTAVR